MIETKVERAHRDLARQYVLAAVREGHHETLMRTSAEFRAGSRLAQASVAHLVAVLEGLGTLDASTMLDVVQGFAQRLVSAAAESAACLGLIEADLRRMETSEFAGAARGRGW